MSYQLVLLGPDAVTASAKGLVKDFEAAVALLGLDPAKDVDILDAAALALSPSGATRAWDADAPTVAVWVDLGTPTVSAAEEAFVSRLLREGVPVFPVLNDLGRAATLRPSALRDLNCHRWDPLGPGAGRSAGDLTALVNRILQGLGLLRHQRRVFISYKRSEATGVARQLCGELSLRGFDVFLDEASIDSGVSFSEAIWERLADTEVLVLLDSHHVWTSAWVNQELARANVLGIGLLQVAWPGAAARASMGFGARVDISHGEASRAMAGSPLNAPTVGDIVDQAESLRVGARKSRRDRVVANLLADPGLAASGVSTTAHADGPVVVRRSASGASGPRRLHLYPHIGLPRSQDVQSFTAREDAAGASSSASRPPADHATLVYSELGLRGATLGHIEWLNERLDPAGKSLLTPVGDLGGYLGRYL